LGEPAVTVTRFLPDQWPLYRALRLACLADAPDAFGATLAEQQDWPDMLWQMRLQAGIDALDACPLLASCDGVPAGLAWGKLEADGVHVYQVWVAPAFRGRGLAGALLDAVIDWARAMHAGAVHLSVALGAAAANRLYLRAGFRPNGPPHVLRAGTQLFSQPMYLPL
jgi:GNAT superfamily N-acetyltransferase